MSKRPPQHVQIEDRINHAIARIQGEVQLSNMGRQIVKQSGLKGPALAAAASKAPRSGWVPSNHVFTLDSFGCIRRVELRFKRTGEDGEIETMSRMLLAGPDGTIRED